ncbi:helix-turn-helix transcriptional regulator [Paenibacillus sp. MWE-103]|uniref:Helix-turn-helix transcriptional regulator n=1 Tax=Paenibacillus artemisiicola TaxID=1172618 RepID=A0ABS3WJN3_9BACL|nr:AraC family transcriptional regulator [Paenibacillus artemisiicola]MBO7748531.1 helix-turn-helix transcriptional regulator [Paenibacillus artemisiicola]
MHEPDLAALHPRDTLDALSDFRFPPYVTLAHIFHAPPDWSFAGRTLKQYALNYVIGGRGEFAVDGRVHPVEKGDVFFYRPYESHGLLALPGKPFISITVVFHFADLPFPAEELLAGAHMLGRFDGHAVERQFAELVAKYRQPGLENGLRCQSLLLAILAETSRRVAEGRQETAVSRKSLAKLIQVKNHIEARLDAGLDAAELERLSGLTWNYLIAEFKKAFGITPMQFLIWARVAKAKELALQSPLSFGEIAAQVGYNDIHAFGKMFKKKTGMSLTEFCSSLYGADHRIDWPKADKEGGNGEGG